MAENLQPGGAEGIHDADGQRGLGAHDREVDPLLLRELQQAGHIRVLHGHALRLRGDAGIAGGAEDLRHLRGTAERIHDGVAASAATDHEHFLIFCHRTNA